MHLIHGVPQLDHDQINILAHHLEETKSELNVERTINGDDSVHSKVYKLARKLLKTAGDWNQWEKAEVE